MSRVQYLLIKRNRYGGKRLIFRAQAAFGGPLLQTGLLAGWIGWATIIWSLGLLVYLPAFKPRDIYYPWLHYVAPLLIGIGLLVKG